MKRAALLLTAGLLLSLSLSATATTLYVNVNNSIPAPPYTNWLTAATNIQAAVDAAQAGDTVLVTNGGYATGGRAVYGTMTNRVAVDKRITLLSVNGPQFTVIKGYQVPGTINGDEAIRCVYLANRAVLSGFTLTNGATRASGDYDSEQSGGGVLCQSSTALVTNCTLTCNSAEAGGGACDGTLNNCTLTRNSAEAGGGAYSGTLNNCTLTSNSGYYGGGGCCYGTLNDCTLTGNSAEAGGGAYSGTLNNCILYYNSASTRPNYDEYSTLNYCCTTPLPGSGPGNIAAEPLFVDRVNGNLRLQANSPCINAGANSYVSGTTDLAGRPRIAGGTVDMGAFEFQSDLPPAIVWNQNQVLGPNVPGYPFAGIYQFSDLTIGDNVQVSSSNISHLVIQVSGTLTLGQWAAFQVRNGYYADAPQLPLTNMVSEADLNRFGVDMGGFRLYANMFGRGGDGGPGGPQQNAEGNCWGVIRGGGGGGGGGFGGGLGGLGATYYGGTDGMPNGGAGGNGGGSYYQDVHCGSGASTNVASETTGGSGGGSNSVGGAGRCGVGPELPGSSGGGGGNGGDAGYVPGYTSGNGGGGGGFGGGILTIIAARVVWDSNWPPRFCASGQRGGLGGEVYSWRLNGQYGEGGMVIIQAADSNVLTNYCANPSDYSLSGMPQKVFALPVPPFIIQQPASQTNAVGSTVAFSVAATGTPPLGYQWSLNGTNLAGAVNAVLTLTNVQMSQAGNYRALVNNGLSTATSQVARLTLFIAPPVILNPPLSQVVALGGNVAFQLGVDGSPPFAYQWRRNDTNLAGATAAALTLTNVQLAQAGDYRVVVTNSGGAVTSQVATLTILITPPTVAVVPPSRAAGVGTDVTFTGLVGGSPPFSYQWRFNGTNLAGATNLTLVLTNVQLADAGVYALRVTNSAGYASASATLAVGTVWLEGVSQAVGGCQFNLHSPTGALCVVEASTNLVNWTPLATLTNGTGLTAFTTPVAGFPRRFYRVKAFPNAPSEASLWLGAAQLVTGELEFSLHSAAGKVCVIEASTNLVHWTPTLTITNLTGTVSLTNAATGFPYRFFRATHPQ
jgi:hypothetical protein